MPSDLFIHVQTTVSWTTAWQEGASHLLCMLRAFAGGGVGSAGGKGSEVTCIWKHMVKRLPCSPPRKGSLVTLVLTQEDEFSSKRICWVALSSPGACGADACKPFCLGPWLGCSPVSCARPAALCSFLPHRALGKTLCAACTAPGGPCGPSGRPPALRGTRFAPLLPSGSSA